MRVFNYHINWYRFMTTKFPIANLLYLVVICVDEEMHLLNELHASLQRCIIFASYLVYQYAISLVIIFLLLNQLLLCHFVLPILRNVINLYFTFVIDLFPPKRFAKNFSNLFWTESKIFWTTSISFVLLHSDEFGKFALWENRNRYQDKMTLLEEHQ